MEELFFMIKSDWLEHKDKILEFLEERWFSLDFWIIVDFNKKLLDIIYWWDEKWLYDLHKKYYLSEQEYKKVYLWFTRGELWDLVSVTWKNCDYKKCRKDTIRNKFWTWQVSLGNQIYFLNSIHTPKDQEELKENLKVKEYILNIKKDMKNIVNMIIIDNKKNILLLKRSSKSKFYPWDWSLPWWTCEEWETLEQTLRREIKEEIWTNILYYKYLSSLFVYWNRAIYYYGQIENWDIILNDENEDYMWISPERISNIELAFKQNTIVNLFNNKKNYV